MNNLCLIAALVTSLVGACTTTPEPTVPTSAVTPPAAGSPTARRSPPASIAVDGFDLATREGEAVALTGLLFADRTGAIVLSATLCETAPPRACGTVVRLDLADPQLAAPLLTRSATGVDGQAVVVRWSSAGVVASGTITAGRLVVTTLALAAT